MPMFRMASIRILLLLKLRQGVMIVVFPIDVIFLTGVRRAAWNCYGSLLAGSFSS